MLSTDNPRRSSSPRSTTRKSAAHSKRGRRLSSPTPRCRNRYECSRRPGATSSKSAGCWCPLLGGVLITRATNDDGVPVPTKTYNTRGGVKEETEPRWLEAVAVDGSTFDLVENWAQLKLPPTVSGRPRGRPAASALAAADSRIRGKRRVLRPYYCGHIQRPPMGS